jgi:anaerobic C4-dicarboxylate transporter
VSDRILRAGVVTAVAGAAAQILVHLLNVFAFDSRYYKLDASAEGTPFSWVSSMATLGVALGVLAWGVLDPAVRTRALALAVLFAYFSFDDFVEVHERIGDAIEDRLDLPEAVGPRIWIAIYLPLLAAAALALRSMFRHTSPSIRRYQIAGLALLVASVAAEGVGVITKKVQEHGIDSPHLVRAGFEEAIEIAGWSVLAAAMFAAAYAVLERKAPVSDTGPSLSP